MKRFRCLIFKMLTALSLVLCVATVKGWLSSYGTCNRMELHRVSHSVAGQNFERLLFECDRGGVYIARNGVCYPPIQLEKHPNYWEADGWHWEKTSTNSSGHYPYIRAGRGSPEAFRVAGFQLTTGLRAEPKDPYRRYTAALVVPLWFVALVTAIAPVRFIVRWHRRRWQPMPEAPQCTSCSYDLTGNVSGVCPECGTKVGATG